MQQLHGPSVLPPTARCDILVVLLHGVGADGHDLIDLAPVLAPMLPGTAFYAPDGPEPCDMAPFGRQWFSLQDRRFAAHARRHPPLGAILDDYLDGLLARHRLPPERLALLGFSQGTMMALYVAPRRTPAIAAVLASPAPCWGRSCWPAEARSHAAGHAGSWRRRRCRAVCCPADGGDAAWSTPASGPGHRSPRPAAQHRPRRHRGRGQVPRRGSGRGRGTVIWQLAHSCARPRLRQLGSVHA